MAGTDSTRVVSAALGATPERIPVVILVRPQLDENMGTAVRAMLNCGLTELRLVSPRDDHLSDKAIAAASGAGQILRDALVFTSLDAAIADFHRVYAASARRREMAKPIMTPRHALAEIREALPRGERCAILFGAERTGLTNDEMAQSDSVVEVPLNPSFASLNLAQAVLVMGYEWFQGGTSAPPVELPLNGGRPATREELLNLFVHLEHELDDCGFLRVAEKRPSMVRNLRNMFGRAGLTLQEVRTLHGIIKELRWGRKSEDN